LIFGYTYRNQDLLVCFRSYPMQSFRKLIVWEKAHHLTLDIYSVTKEFPGTEMYGLTSQLRRASSSVPTNLAEGAGKLSDLDFRKYVSVAFGSAHEVEYLLLLSRELSYMHEEDYIKLNDQVEEVKRMLAGLINSLTKKIYTKTICISILVLSTLSILMTLH
jgi:four helix bundle protein